ncbi:ganglioside GM2 activator-like [Limulus polyphemus]|uniref:Ganglioside GM2 activator-like n=1 Tax=Limulus polyphemus TaxID=6850 RepID=A0ABM1ST53_LIMPO|nr:ganglioside GM2 activator-like [Limulus polyphemus]
MSRLSTQLVLVVMIFGLTETADVTTWTGYFQDKALRLAYHLNSHSIQKRSTGRRGFAKLAFEHCGDEDDPVYVKNFVIEPNPVLVPGQIGVGMTLDVRQNQSSPLPVQLEMMKKVPLLFGLSTWLPIPCLPNDVGSCTFEDLCATRLFTDGTCVSPTRNVTVHCGCPFTKGEYNLKPVVFNISHLPSSVPSYLLAGQFYVKALVKKDGRHLACYSTIITLDL